MKRILITGADSYIGMSVEKWLMKPEFAGMYQVDTVDMRGDGWKEKDFSGYDTVFHVAGIAHQKETKENTHLYYEVNRDLAIETAKKAKVEGVKQFVLLSSMSVYGMERGIIGKNTVPAPKTNYGKSKLQADQKILKIENKLFKVAIVRPPMVYGRGCKGNYTALAKLAMRLPVFPDIDNERSMLYIKNFNEFFRLLVESEDGGIYFPQNTEYVKTSEMVVLIAKARGKKIKLTKSLNWAVYLTSHIPGKVGNMANKAFGNLIYEKKISEFSAVSINYQLFDIKKSILMTENERAKEHLI